MSVPATLNQVWSMDFMGDRLNVGRSISTFNVKDNFNREGLGIDVGPSLLRVLVLCSEQIIEWP